MKTNLLLLVGLFCAGNGFAQTQKGNGILGGRVSLNFNQQTSTSPILQTPDPISKSTAWDPAFAITVGRFWKDNWLMGITVSGETIQARSKLQSTPNLTYVFSQLAVSATPFIRRYWELNSFYLFAGAGLSVIGSHGNQPNFTPNGQSIESG